LLREAIGDVDSPRAAAILPNAAATIWLAGLEATLPAAAERANLFFTDAATTEKLQEMIDFGDGE